MDNLVRKLTSRKLWLAIIGIATGVYIALGGDADTASTVMGSVTALVSAVSYIITEGCVDAASVKAATDAAKTTAEVIDNADTAV